MVHVNLRGIPLTVCTTHAWVFRQAAAGTWEAGTYAVLDRYLTPETTVLDIGAWVGPISLYAAAKARQVYSFEPDPVAYRILADNLRANGCENVLAFHKAIALHDGTIQLGVRGSPGDSTSSILADAADTWQVPCLRLDTFLRQHPIDGPLLVKMDVEGFEYQLLPAAMHALRGREFVLHLSTHPHLIERSATPTGLLAKWQGLLARRKAHMDLARTLQRLETRHADGSHRKVSFLRRQRERWWGDLLSTDRDRVVIGRAA